MKFILEIRLGNAAMQTPADIAAALRETADKLHDLEDNTGRYAEPFESLFVLPATPNGTILDLNGNLVGTWEVAS